MFAVGWFPTQTFSADAVNAVDNSHFDAETLDVWLWCEPTAAIGVRYALIDLVALGVCSNFSNTSARTSRCSLLQ